MTSSRLEIDHATSSSSLSTSPTMTSSTVSSERVARQERGDLCGNSYPAAVSSKHVERQERGDPCSSGIPAEQLLTKPTKNPKPNINDTIKNGETCLIPTYRNGCKNSEKILWMIETSTPVLLMNHLESLQEVRIWVSTVFILTSLKTKIARSARGPKSRGPRAEDALAESYLVQKFLVI